MTPTNPNSSLLAQFDPICSAHIADTTPARPATTKNSEDALSLSTFFNRINTAQPNEIPPPNNRGSLIDFSFNFEDLKISTLEKTPTKSRRQPTDIHRDVENAVPFKLARTSPHKQRDAHPPASPSKRARLLDTGKHSSAHARRSSLDISTLSLDIKQRLEAENMSFDILKDEVSFLTDMVEEEPSGVLPQITRSQARVKPSTQR